MLPTYIDAHPRHRIADVYNREELGLVDDDTPTNAHVGDHTDDFAEPSRTPSSLPTSSRSSIVNAVLPLDWVVPSPGSTSVIGPAPAAAEHTRDGDGGNGAGVVSKMIAAYACTGNPYLWIPSQPVALLCCSLWSLVESIFKICTKKDIDFDRVHAMVTTATTLARATKSAVATCGWARSLVRKLKAAPPDGVGVAAVFTESSGILSLCMALSALLLDDAQPFFANTATGDSKPTARLSHLSLSLVAESVARICRVHLRTSGRTANDYICGALGMKGMLLRFPWFSDQMLSQRAHRTFSSIAMSSVA